MNIARLRELCDAFDAGALRGDELRELVGLAREAAERASVLQIASCTLADCAEIFAEEAEAWGIIDDIADLLRYNADGAPGLEELPHGL